MRMWHLLALAGVASGVSVIDVSTDFRYAVPVSLTSSAVTVYSLSLTASQFAVIAINSTDIAASLIDVTTGSNVTQPLSVAQVGTGADAATVVSVHPGCNNLTGVGSQARSFRLELTTVQATLLVSLEITHGQVLTKKSTVSATLGRTNSLYYGVVALSDSLPLKVKATPSTLTSSADVDLFVYGARDTARATPIFPTDDARNHIENWPETAEISSVPSPNCACGGGCMYVVEAYAPSTSVSSTSFSIVYEAAGEDDDGGFRTGVMVVVAAATMLFMSLFTAIAVMLRLRVAYVRHFMDEYEVEPGITENELNRLKITRFKSTMVEKEDASCSICLADYNEGDSVVGLPCGHLFHKDCIGPWIETKHRCPLCRQPINTGEDKRSPQTTRRAASRQVSSSPQGIELARLGSEPNSQLSARNSSRAATSRSTTPVVTPLAADSKSHSALAGSDPGQVV